MFRACLVLAALFAATARGAAPSYTAESIVNGANFAAGPAAPNSILSLFGSDLAWDTEGLTEEKLSAGTLPTFLADVRVYVANYVTPLFYVSPGQINFLVPGNLRPGKVSVRVVRQGVSGPAVVVTLVDAAPQLFQTADGYVIAQHSDYSLITPEAPAGPGEVIAIYAVGLGKTLPNPDPGTIPTYAAQITRLSDFQVSIAGVVLSPDQIQYVGVTPGSAGLYQINLALPDPLEAEAEIRIAVGDQISSPGPKLAVNSPPPQPETSGGR